MSKRPADSVPFRRRAVACGALVCLLAAAAVAGGRLGAAEASAKQLKKKAAALAAAESSTKPAPPKAEAPKPAAKPEAVAAAPKATAASAKTPSYGGAAASNSPLERPLAGQAESQDFVVKNVNRLIRDELKLSPGEVAKPVDDATFLRRISLDILGLPPSPAEISAFLLDPAPDKRDAWTRRWLARSEYGRNWGRYWRDVIMYRRTEDRGLIAAPAAEELLTTKFNENVHWDEIATEFMTATGDVTENGATAIIMAQNGETEDVTAEVSRIFLGIQISCAQCHDHPTDRWKRQQFHELAAFFPRIAVARIQSDGKRIGFEVKSVDREPRFARPGGMRRGSLEHYMPDLQDPSSKGTLVPAKFFISGKAAKPGLSDAERRGQIASWITSPQNPWFAKAFVNRVWAELVGVGFYEPIDDMGPDREATAPMTLNFLAAQFAHRDYDVKWLFRTICATDAYQRSVRTKGAERSHPFVAGVPQRLRSDQLFDCVLTALGLPEPKSMGRGMMGGGGPAGRFAGNPRFAFQQVFGFDPSSPRTDVAGSIPQALALMNGPNLGGLAIASPRTQLGRILRENSDDEAVVEELYLRCLSREPSPAEVQTCLDHVKQVGGRGEAFEDVLWSLLNSTEFLHRR